MRITLACLLAAALALPLGLAAKESTVDNDKPVLGYAIGTEIAHNLSAIKDDVELDDVIAGLKDGMAGKEPKYSADELQRVTREFTQRKQKEQQATQKEAGAKNRADGEKYLKANAKKHGVKVTDSGLQYQVIKEGDGPKPKATDTVKVHYTGTLIDGTVFDSSYKRGEPAVFPVNGVIPGWVEALQLMPVGSKYRLVIPSDLAYGPHGQGPQIGPDSVLVFEVELIDIEK
jgi:FKBP-type peptidyl-prolyl cis-trans isomerase